MNSWCKCFTAASLTHPVSIVFWGRCRWAVIVSRLVLSLVPLSWLAVRVSEEHLHASALGEALASSLTVHDEAPVVRVERDRTGGALVLANGTVVEGDRIVLAVPAPAAASLVADPSPLEAHLLSTPYSSGLLVVLACSRRLEERELGGAYGLLASPSQAGPIAALCVASRAGHAALGADAAAVKVPGMKDILAAGKKPLDEVAVAELSPVEVSLEVTGRAKPVAKARRNETFTGDDAAAQLVAALRNAGAL